MMNMTELVRSSGSASGGRAGMGGLGMRDVLSSKDQELLRRHTLPPGSFHVSTELVADPVDLMARSA